MSSGVLSPKYVYVSPPEGCDENGPAAALLVGYVSL
jgi:hypothetical protein